MSDEENEISEEEQLVIAMDWFIAMWDEAIKRGVTEDTMGMITLSATITKLVKQFGSENAAAILQRTLDNFKAGQFDLNEEEPDAVN